MEYSAKAKSLLTQKLWQKTESLLTYKSSAKKKLLVMLGILNENIVPPDLEINSEHYITFDP
jgi:hypothetical protein